MELPNKRLLLLFFTAGYHLFDIFCHAWPKYRHVGISFAFLNPADLNVIFGEYLFSMQMG